MHDNPNEEHVRILLDRHARVIELLLPAQTESLDFDLLNERVGNSISQHVGSNWIVDLSAADYFGSALLGMLVNIRSRVRHSQGALVLCHLSPALTRVIRASSMEKLFVIVETRSDALASF